MNNTAITQTTVGTTSPCNLTGSCNDTSYFGNDTAAFSPDEVDIASIVRVSLIGALTVFGNFLVVLSVALNDELRATRYAYVASLASVDLLTGCYFAVGAMDAGAPQILMRKPPLYCNILMCTLFFLWSTSIFHMVLIAIDRYLTITNPFKYNEIMTRGRCMSLIGCAWVSGATISLLFFVVRKSEEEITYNPYGCLPSFILNGEYLMFFCFGVFFLPLVIMSVLYGRLAQIAFKQRRKINALQISLNSGSGDAPETVVVVKPAELTAPPANQPNDDAAAAEQTSQTQKSRMKIFKNEMRTTKTLSMILGVFAVCWFPFAIMLVLEHTIPDYYNDSLKRAAFSLGMSNSAFNPLVYALRDIPLRKTFKKILKCQRV